MSQSIHLIRVLASKSKFVAILRDTFKSSDLGQELLLLKPWTCCFPETIDLKRPFNLKQITHLEAQLEERDIAATIRESLNPACRGWPRRFCLLLQSSADMLIVPHDKWPWQKLCLTLLALRSPLCSCLPPRQAPGLIST